MHYLSTSAIINVKEAIVLTMHASSVGDVYFKLVKYMFRVKLTLQRHHDAVSYGYEFNLCMHSAYVILILTQEEKVQISPGI